MNSIKKLFRGNKFGVFAGPNGYYVAAMARDGVSHYQPANGGSPDLTIEEANATAKDREMSDEYAGASETHITSYEISNSRDGIWAGDGIYDHRDAPSGVSGNIRDCGAVPGDDTYAAIEDALTEMYAPADGQIVVGGKALSWTLVQRKKTTETTHG